jgi:uncharacterized protein YkwD
MRPVLPAALLVSAALIAGCGGSNGSTPSSPSNVSPKANIAPSTGGQIRVDSTSLHVGDATTGSSSGGIEVLPNTKVPPSQIHHEGVGAGASCPDVDLVPSAANMAKVQAATLCLLNGERADEGLAALKEDTALDNAAAVHNDDMIKGQYFDHIAPDGSSPVDRIQATGYLPKVGAWTVGENLAWGTGDLSTPKNIVKAWMASTGHRENILNAQYNDIGFGIGLGNPRSADGSGATYTNTFGGKTTAPVAAAPTSIKKKLKPRKAKAARAKARAARARAARARASRNG